MNNVILMAAIIRLMSLAYFISGVGMVATLTTYFSMYLRAAELSVGSRTGLTGTISTACGIGYQWLIGLVLWVFAIQIAKLILKSIERKFSREQ